MSRRTFLKVNSTFKDVLNIANTPMERLSPGFQPGAHRVQRTSDSMSSWLEVDWTIKLHFSLTVLSMASAPEISTVVTVSMLPPFLLASLTLQFFT